MLRKKGKGGEEVLLRLDAFSLQPALIQKELLRRCLEMGTAGLKDVGSVHMEGLRKLAASPCGKQMTLPGGRLALREKEFLRFTNGMEREETADGVWNGGAVAGPGRRMEDRREKDPGRVSERRGN